jgi:hypothetical protein
MKSLANILTNIWRDKWLGPRAKETSSDEWGKEVVACTFARQLIRDTS